MTSSRSGSATLTGTAMALAAMVVIQFGIALALGLVDELGAGGVAWIRLAWAAVVIVLVARPWRLRFTRRAIVTSALLGVVTAAMTILFMFAASHLPLGTAVALEFLGPLTVTVVRGRGIARLWGLVAALGVVALTEPWHGEIDLVGVAFALAAAVCWASYILLTQRAGDAAEGIGALAISMPAAALVATATVGPAAFGRLTPELVLMGLGLAILVPVVPFILEFLALRRLTTAAFGTLTCLEPAVALGVGFLLLGQVPRPLAAVGVVLVVVAGIGATRTGGRPPATGEHREVVVTGTATGAIGVIVPGEDEDTSTGPQDLGFRGDLAALTGALPIVSPGERHPAGGTGSTADDPRPTRTDAEEPNGGRGAAPRPGRPSDDDPDDRPGVG